MEETTTKRIFLALEKQEDKTNQIVIALEKQETTTKQIMEFLIKMKTQMDHMETRLSSVEKNMATKNDLQQLENKFATKFDMLFGAIGDITEKFTVIDYKFLQLKRQVLST